MAKLVYDKDGRLIFTKEMKKEYTILFADDGENSFLTD